MLSGLNGGHLLEQIFPDEESDAGKEGEHSDPNPVIASVVIFIVEAHFLSVFPCDVPLVAYASKHDYREEL